MCCLTDTLLNNWLKHFLSLVVSQTIKLLKMGCLQALWFRARWTLQAARSLCKAPQNLFKQIKLQQNAAEKPCYEQLEIMVKKGLLVRWLEIESF
jgi:hypothetical protein